MTPDEEATFIALWQRGMETAEIAEQLGIPAGTARSRAYALQQQGKIPARPKGGRRVPARRTTAQVSPDTLTDTQVSSDTPPVQYLPPPQSELHPLLTDILQELRQLTGALAARVSADTPEVPHDTPRVSTGTPLPIERGKSIRWNLHLSERVRERVKTLAKARGLQDSQMVEELLWQALSLVEEPATSDG
jgi:hypothetical protein